MKNLKKVSENVKKSPAAKIAAGKKAALAKRVLTVSAKGVSAKTNRSTTMATKKPTPKKTVTPKSETVDIDREQLLALGAELNTLLFEGSEVEYEELDDEALEAQIRQDCTEIDPADKFSDEAKAIIAELDIDIEWAAPKKATGKAAPAKAKKAAEPAKEKKPAGEKPPAGAKKAPTAKKEAAPAKEKKAPIKRNGTGIGEFVRGILTSSKKSWDLKNEDILKSVKDKFPDCNTTTGNIGWYRADLKKKGLVPAK